MLPRRLPRFSVMALLALGLALAPSAARANGAVLGASGAGEPSQLDVSSAVAVTPYGTTRWSRLTVSGALRIMWLVPVRRGAALDWASDTWLDALDEATAPRVIPPSSSPPCDMPSRPERVATFGSAGPRRTPNNLTVLDTEAALRAHVNARDFTLSPYESARVTEVYAKGSVLVGMELDTPENGTSSTPTLRVSDDAPPMLPLALTGSLRAQVRVTAFVLADSGATLASATDADPESLVWGATKSNYGTWRASTLAAGRGAEWLRESSARVLFAGASGPLGAATPAVIDGFFSGDASCIVAARGAASASGTLGRTCAEGTLAKVPGGSCAPTSSTIDPAPFVCGDGSADLAIALSGLSPKAVAVSRFAGIVPQLSLGQDIDVQGGAPLASPILRAGSYEACQRPPPSPGIVSPSDPQETVTETDSHFVTTHGACGGSSTTVVTDDTEEDTSSDSGCGGSTSGTSSSEGGSDGESCSKDSKGDDGWDSSDDDDTSEKKDDSCSKSSSSSSSSSGSSDSDGWDSNDMKAKSKSASSAAPRAKKKRSSPVSRMALFLVAIVLPLRRRSRRALRF